jgi:CBS domain-containing protein
MTTEVPVQVRRVVQGDGSLRTALSVYCPFVARSCSLEECDNCEHCRGSHIDRGAPGRSVVVCRHRNIARPGGRPAPTAGDRTRVAEVMSREVVCVTVDVTIDSLVALFVERGFSGVPVVDTRGRPAGMVSKTDLVRQRFESWDTAEIGGDERNAVVRLGPGFHEQAAPRTVREMMTPVAFTVEVSTSVSQAAALMAYQQVHRVPVVSESGEVVGMLAALDILRWLGEEDGYLRRAATADDLYC